MVPATVLGMVFGHLDLREVVTTCWLVCTAWKQRMQAPYLDLACRVDVYRALAAVEPRLVRSLAVSVSVDADAVRPLTNVLCLQLFDSSPKRLMCQLDQLWPSLQTLTIKWLYSVTSLDWHLPELQELDFSWTNLEHADLEPLVRMPCLAKLNLYDTQVSAAAVRVLARVCSLTCLALGGNRSLDDPSICGLQSLIRLRDLSLRSTGITDKSIESLSSLPQLERLDLARTRLRQPALDRLRRLRTLDLSACRLEVLRLPWELEHLDLHGATVRAIGAPAPWMATSLKTLDLVGSQVTWEMINAPSLEHLVVGRDPARAARCFPSAKITEVGVPKFC
jgi:Leucine-rich repeat (LRR) protein